MNNSAGRKFTLRKNSILTVIHTCGKTSTRFCLVLNTYNCLDLVETYDVEELNFYLCTYA
jgi:hypothetical protein